MPIYLYKCSKCKSLIEKIQPNNAVPPSRCDDCGEMGTLQKQISAPACFQLKGGGYYESDFKHR